MSSEIEKIVMPTDRLKAQHVLPNVGNGPLRIGLDRHGHRFCLLNPAGHVS